MTIRGETNNAKRRFKMKRVLLAFLLLSLPFVAGLVAQKNMGKTQKRQPKEITLQKNRATPKPGYTFEKTSDTTFAVRRANGGGRTGLGYAVECRCSQGVPSTCIAEISANSATCKGDTCCSFRLVNTTLPAKIQ